MEKKTGTLENVVIAGRNMSKARNGRRRFRGWIEPSAEAPMHIGGFHRGNSVVPKVARISGENAAHQS